MRTFYQLQSEVYGGAFNGQADEKEECIARCRYTGDFPYYFPYLTLQSLLQKPVCSGEEPLLRLRTQKDLQEAASQERL